MILRAISLFQTAARIGGVDPATVEYEVDYRLDSNMHESLGISHPLQPRHCLWEANAEEHEADPVTSFTDTDIIPYN